MAAAIRLRHAGHDVVIVERNAELGGKLAARTIDGFTFDTGPSLLTLPAVFDHLFALAGSRAAPEADSTAMLAAAVDLVRLDPICRYRWPNGTTWDHRADRAEAVRATDLAFPGQGPSFERFLDRASRIWEVAERTFFAGPMESPIALFGRMRSPTDLLAIDALRSLDARARSTFDDPRLVQWVDRYATYSGSSPWKAPATLACIAWIEQAYGAWYVQGGLGMLASALHKTAVDLGVEVRTSTDVTALVADTKAVHGVRLDDGTTLGAEVVVANVDAEHLYEDLLHDRAALRRARRAPRSTSGFALLLGLEGRTEDAAHHTVAFSADYRAEFGPGVPADPTLYVANASATDVTAAPRGCESWFVLANVPAGATADWDAYGRRIIDSLGVTDRVQVCQAITPADIAERYRASGGAIYGASSNGSRAAFLRPANRGPRRGLYLVGGSSHPGGGLPLVALSGRIVAAMVERDLAPH